MSTIVTCPNGHRFPVNLKKHLDRTERFCPRCKQPVQVRSKVSFTPNPDWIAKREGYRNAAHKKEVQKRLAEMWGVLLGGKKKRRRKAEN